MKPNIVIILLDAVRAQNLPMYGYSRNTMPFLSSIESELAVYENAISSSYWTMPSIASLFTGMHTSGHGLVADGDILNSCFATLPKVLRQSGYRTSAFVRNIYVSDYSGLNRDFQDFYSKYSIDKIKHFVSKISNNIVNKLQPPGITRSSEIPLDADGSSNDSVYNFIARCCDLVIDSGSSHFVRCFSKWLKQTKSEPFFAYLHFFETHTPYRAPFGAGCQFLSLKDNIKKLFINQDHLKYLLNKCQMTPEDFDILLSAYDNSIRYTDQLIQKIIRLLQKQGVYDDTLLVVLSDHGDNIGDHGMMFHYFGLYDTLIKIPLVIKFPDNIQITGKISKLVQNTDIFPTILSLLGIQDENLWVQIQGNDLLEKAQPVRERGLAISELIKVFGPDRMRYKEQLHQFDRRLLSLRTKNQKFIYSANGDHECYDLKNDPRELNNLYLCNGNFDELVAKALIYFNRMESFYINNRQKIDGEKNNTEIDDAVAEQLKSMGYM